MSEVFFDAEGMRFGWISCFARSQAWRGCARAELAEEPELATAAGKLRKRGIGAV